MSNRIDEIQERLAAAVPGPWSVGEQGYELGTKYWRRWIEPNIGEIGSDADAQLIAHAPDDLRYLLTEIERLEGQLTEVYEVVREAGEIYYHDSLWLGKEQAETRRDEMLNDYDPLNDWYDEGAPTIRVRRIGIPEAADE